MVVALISDRLQRRRVKYSVLAPALAYIARRHADDEATRREDWYTLYGASLMRLAVEDAWREMWKRRELETREDA